MAKHPFFKSRTKTQWAKYAALFPVTLALAAIVTLWAIAVTLANLARWIAPNGRMGDAFQRSFEKYALPFIEWRDR